VKAIGRTTTGQQKAGGLAALYLAAAYLLAMPFFLVVVDYPSVVDPAKKVALLASNHAGMHVMYLITYVVFGIVLAVLALSLYRRLKSAAPVVMQVATAVGLLWAFVLVASGMVFNAGMAATVALYPSDPGQAVSIWQAIEPVAQGLGGSGGEILGGLWVLLVSSVGLRERGLPRPLGWLGMAVGLVGVLSVIPPLKDAAIAFGLLQIGWFVWLGITMLRTTERSRQPLALEVEPA
jgi:MFS family permease